jgi:hypothetical protein
MPPHRMTQRQRPPAQVAPGQARTYRAPAQAMPAQRAPTKTRTAPQVQPSQSPWSVDPNQQPSWATKSTEPTPTAP